MAGRDTGGHVPGRREGRSLGQTEKVQKIPEDQGEPAHAQPGLLSVLGRARAQSAGGFFTSWESCARLHRLVHRSFTWALPLCARPSAGLRGHKGTTLDWLCPGASWALGLWSRKRAEVAIYTRIRAFGGPTSWARPRMNCYRAQRA